MACYRAFYAALTIGCASAAEHTWTVDPVSGIAGGRDLYSVSLSTKGNVGFAVGEGGVVLRWDGQAWKADSDAMKVAKGGAILVVAVDASGKRALAVGSSGLILTWNGTTWKHDLAAEKLAIGRSLFAVDFDAQGRTAWVVGQYGMALHWSGSKWTRTPTPFKMPGHWQGGAPVDTFGMWAVRIAPNGVDAVATGNANRILRWDGRTWKDDKQAARLGLRPDAFSGLHSIAMSRDGKKGWMVGGETNLTWSNAKWQKGSSAKDSPNDYPDLYAVGCDIAGQTAFAVGGSGSVMRWDGAKWTSDPTGQAAAEGMYLSAVSLSGNGNLGFAVGPYGSILRWDGKVWKRDPAGERVSYGKFSSVATTADGKSALAICYTGDPLRWNGTSWKIDSDHPSGMRLTDLWLAPDGRSAFGIGEDGIFRWNGSEWLPQPSGRSFHSLAMTPNGQLGFAGNIFGTIYRYDGSRWTEDIQGTKQAGGQALWAIYLSPDGKFGFAGGSDIFLRWDGSAWHKDPTLSKWLTFHSICLNEKGDLGFTIGDDGSNDRVVRWDGTAWRPDPRAEKVFAGSEPTKMALSADGRTGIAIGGSCVYFWDGVKWSRDAIATDLAQGQLLMSVCLDATGTSGWVLGHQGFLMRYQAN